MDLTLCGFTLCLNLNSLLLVTVVLLLLLYFVNRPPQGLPPFPTMPLPVLGNLWSLERDSRAQFTQWSKKHGDIFSLYFGPKLTIVLSGFATIKDAFVKHADVFSDRPNIMLFSHLLHGKGILSNSGLNWKSQRKFSLIALREFGFGRKSMETGILEEALDVLEFFASKKGEKYRFSDIFNISTSNVICSMLFGRRFKHTNANFVASCKALDNAVEKLSAQGLFNFYPFLLNIPGAMKDTNIVFNEFAYFEEHLIKSEIKRHYDEYDGSTPDFVAAYIKEIKTRESSGLDTSELKDNFTQTITDLFIAGTETTSTTLKWLVLFLITNPEVQEKCFHEIKDNIGLDRLPTLKDKPVLPYLEATIAEAQRKANLLPFGVFHAVSEDIEFRGFNIPKGTIIMLNMESVLLDPKVYPKPEEFRPERFLDKSGSFFKPESFIPFSAGRRVCLGESLAKMELFLFSAALIQNFKLVQPEDEPTPSLEAHLGGTLMPQPYKIKALRRNDKFPEINCM